MAVEARNLDFLTENMNPYFAPLSGITSDSFVPIIYGTEVDSGLTYVGTRKRARESLNNPMMNYSNGQILQCGNVTFFGEDLSAHIQQQNMEIDRLIAHHTEKSRMEIEERSKQYSRRIIAAVEESIAKRLRAKDDEIEQISRLNWALEEKIKTIAMEGQIWREMAHTNEVTAHTLRANLEQALVAQHFNNDTVPAIEDDAHSCCGDNYEENKEKLGTLGVEGKCRHCGKGQSSVLLLPCRHLCLCTVCGSSVHMCPVCNTPKNASVHVIMSG